MQEKECSVNYTLLDFIRLIVINELELDEDRVNIYNERFKIPTYEGLFVLIESKGISKVISNRNVHVASDSGLTEKQELTVQEMIAVSVMSRNREAEQRKEEILMAITSIYAQQIQEKYSFKIYRNTSIDNLSALEGSGMLNRFEVSLMCVTWHEKTKSADYYDTFDAELNTEKETIHIPIEEL